MHKVHDCPKIKLEEYLPVDYPDRDTHGGIPVRADAEKCSFCGMKVADMDKSVTANQQRFLEGKA